MYKQQFNVSAVATIMMASRDKKERKLSHMPYM